MRAIDYITFDISGWDLLEVKKLEKRWRRQGHNDHLSLNLFMGRPDFESDLSDVQALRKQSQQAIAPFDGIIVDIGTQVISEKPVFYQIIKIPLATQGFSYIGSYTLPFQRMSYAIKVQCSETDTVGQREAYALQSLIEHDKIELDLNHPTFGADSITPEMEQLISSTSDAIQLDDYFPQHPLSRTRRTLHNIQKTIQLNPILKKSNPFRLE